MSSFRSLSNALKRKVGVLHEIGSEVLKIGPEQNKDSVLRYRYQPAKPVSQGWYMVSVSGVRETQGHDFQLHLPCQQAENTTFHMFLGSKKFSKRIIWLPADAPCIEFNISPGNVGKESINLTLVRLSQKFALSRMIRKIKYSSAEGANLARTAQRNWLQSLIGTNQTGVHELFYRYNRLLERHVNQIDYQEWREYKQMYSTEKSERELSLANFPDVTFAVIFTSSNIRVQEAADSLSGLPPEVRRRCQLLMNTSSDLGPIEHLSDTGKITNGEAVQDCNWYDETVGKLDVDYLIVVGDGIVLQDDSFSRLLNSRMNDSDVCLVYPDCDVRIEDELRTAPSFKPEWNPEMLLCGNYVGRFFLLRKTIADEAGGLRFSFGNSVEYDLLIRSIPLLSSLTVLRIPEVLYGRANVSNSSATYLESGSHDVPAMNSYLRSQGGLGRVSNGLMEGIIKVDWFVPQPEPEVDIVIPTRDHISVLDCCVNSILSKTEYSNYTVNIIDNNSVTAESEVYFKQIERNSKCNVLRYPGEFNYSAINNYAVSQTNGKIIVLLNNDTEVINKLWLKNLVAQCLRPSIGCVGAKLYYSSGLIQHAGVIIGVGGVAGHSHRFSGRYADGYCGRLKMSQNISAVTAACLGIRREVYEEVGGLDEINLKVAYNDVDFCLRVQEAGYQNVWTPFVELFHHESISRGSDDTSAKARRFQSEYDYMKTRWRTHELQDPAYNPNLALDLEDFSLAA